MNKEKEENIKLVIIAALALCGVLMVLLILPILHHQIQAIFPIFSEHLSNPSSWTYAGVMTTFCSAVLLIAPFIFAAIFLWKSKKVA